MEAVGEAFYGAQFGGQFRTGGWVVAVCEFCFTMECSGVIGEQFQEDPRLGEVGILFHLSGRSVVVAWRVRA
ncbi:hypothetical protein [Nocardia nepalensis]|uniref:hypothetical protein n=1 Tax=Nocardia nepalensis TaxID=3375448 RepID=UPI003B67ABC8